MGSEGGDEAAKLATWTSPEWRAFKAAYKMMNGTDFALFPVCTPYVLKPFRTMAFHTIVIAVTRYEEVDPNVPEGIHVHFYCGCNAKLHIKEMNLIEFIENHPADKMLGGEIAEASMKEHREKKKTEEEEEEKRNAGIGWEKNRCAMSIYEQEEPEEEEETVGVRTRMARCYATSTVGNGKKTRRR
jgi:hypothetical protein